jgi:amidase
VNVLGPIARSAEDLELILELILKKTGPLVADLDAPPADVKRLKVAAWLDDDFCPVDRKALAVMTAAVDKLEAAGVTVDRNARPNLDPNHSFAVGAWLVTAAMAQSMPPENLDGADMDNALAGASHRQWLDMHADRETIRRLWAEFFRDFDAVLMPTAFVPPFPHQQEGHFGSRTLKCSGDDRAYADLVRWSILTGMAYLPASVPPLGQDADGLPIGMQVVGRYGGDYTTIRLAGLIADLCGGYVPPPIAAV